MNTLWSPYTLKTCRLPNRLVMAPTVKFCINDGSGYVSDELVEHYRCRARTGLGLIIVEGTAPTPGGKLHRNNLGLWDDSFIPGLAKIAEVIHQEGTPAFLQLCYCGVSSKDPAADRTSASPEYYAFAGLEGLSHSLTKEEIRSIQQAYRDAAVRAAKAGFDGIELHCAHHKLYAHFLDRITNHRTDCYGGSAENRARIVNETVELIREAVPGDFVVGERVGVNLPTLEDAAEILQALEKAPPDYFHFSMNIVMPEEREDLPPDFPCNTVVFNGSLLRRQVSVPVILSNEITQPFQADYLIRQDMADLVSLGRPFLADGNWAVRARNGEAVEACRHCRVCQWRTDWRHCPAQMAGMVSANGNT